MRSPVAALGVSPNMLWQMRLRWALSVKPASWALVVRLAPLLITSMARRSRNQRMYVEKLICS